MSASIAQPRRKTHALFLGIFAVLQLLLHLPYLKLPYFWDEMGQFIPASLDIWQKGAWVPVSTTPNVHPPGVMAYLAGVWTVFGYSIPVTRCAMLLLSSLLLLFTFLLAIEVYKRVTVPMRGAPAFAAVGLLLLSPLVVSQSMLAQLDMPAAAGSVAALYFYLRGRLWWCVAACTLLVLAKETGILFPGLFFLEAAWRRRWVAAAAYTIPALALAAWLIYLRAHTGTLLGDSGFEHYNLWFQLHPVRLPLTLFRRVFYLFADNFHIAGTFALLWAFRRTRLFDAPIWRGLATVFVLHVLLVSMLGGAALERYLLPVLPLLYIAIAGAWAVLPRKPATISAVLLFAGFGAGSLFNPPWPYPFENNLSVVDFVTLHREAANYVELHYSGETIASAWPFPDGLRRPEFGYVSKPLKVRGIEDFHLSTIRRLRGNSPDVLVVYSRTWEPSYGLTKLGFVRRLLSTYYFYEPQVSASEIQRELGLHSVMRLERNGQWVEIYAKRGPTVTL